MAKLKLDSAKFEESIGYLKQCFNTQILERVETVYKAIAGLDDGNQVVAQFMDNAKKLQDSYNTCLDGVDNFIKLMEDLYDISEYMKKASIQDVNKRDTSVDVTGIDTSAILV